MPEQTKCPQCGAAVDQTAATCKYCGEPLPKPQAAPPQYAQPPQVIFVQHPDSIQRQADSVAPKQPVVRNGCVTALIVIGLVCWIFLLC